MPVSILFARMLPRGVAVGAACVRIGSIALGKRQRIAKAALFTYLYRSCVNALRGVALVMVCRLYLGFIEPQHGRQIAKA